MIIKLPISRFALKDLENKLIEINLEDAIKWYDTLFVLREKRKRKTLL
jgi:hypothetical protein